jgi:hypothetical protein
MSKVFYSVLVATGLNNGDTRNYQTKEAALEAFELASREPARDVAYIRLFECTPAMRAQDCKKRAIRTLVIDGTFSE